MIIVLAISVIISRWAWLALSQIDHIPSRAFLMRRRHRTPMRRRSRPMPRACWPAAVRWPRRLRCRRRQRTAGVETGARDRDPARLGGHRHPALQLRRQRPGQAGAARTVEIFADRALSQVEASGNGALGQPCDPLAHSRRQPRHRLCPERRSGPGLLSLNRRNRAAIRAHSPMSRKLPIPMISPGYSDLISPRIPR